MVKIQTLRALQESSGSYYDDDMYPGATLADMEDICECTLLSHADSEYLDEGAGSTIVEKIKAFIDKIIQFFKTLAVKIRTAFRAFIDKAKSLFSRGKSGSSSSSGGGSSGSTADKTIDKKLDDAKKEVADLEEELREVKQSGVNQQHNSAPRNNVPQVNIEDLRNAQQMKNNNRISVSVKDLKEAERRIEEQLKVAKEKADKLEKAVEQSKTSGSEDVKTLKLYRCAAWNISAGSIRRTMANAYAKCATHIGLETSTFNDLICGDAIDAVIDYATDIEDENRRTKFIEKRAYDLASHADSMLKTDANDPKFLKECYIIVESRGYSVTFLVKEQLKGKLDDISKEALSIIEYARDCESSMFEAVSKAREILTKQRKRIEAWKGYDEIDPKGIGLLKKMLNAHAKYGKDLSKVTTIYLNHFKSAIKHNHAVAVKVGIL